MEIKNLKHEVKQSISISDYTVLKGMLLSISPNERGQKENATRIHSLCFENTDDNGLNLKKDAGSEQFKIRYQNDDHAAIRLEKKMKRKGCSLERYASLTRRECARIIAGDYEVLSGNEDPLLFEFYNQLKTGKINPKTLVDFTRESFAFAPGNVYITFDSDFCTGFNISDFLNEKHPTIKRTGQIVMKVKYDKYLPEILSRIIYGQKDVKTSALALAVHQI